jgi:hypothetical protein
MHSMTVVPVVFLLLFLSLAGCSTNTTAGASTSAGAADSGGEQAKEKEGGSD